MKIIKSLEESGLFIKDVSEKVKNKAKKKVAFSAKKKVAFSVCH